MSHTAIPPAELEVYKKLPGIKVVVDVGARADTDYIDLKPGIILHAFEPHPEFFAELKAKIGDKPNVFLNKYGLANDDGEMCYSDERQAFLGGEAPTTSWERVLPLQTLDWYIKENGITKIDFLKVDVEGYDYKVFLGAKEALKISRFVQYEHWDDMAQFHELLGKDFDMEYMGYRNVLCINKHLVHMRVRNRIINFIRDNNYKELA